MALSLEHTRGRYTIPKGSLYLAKPDERGTWRRVGNAPEINFTLETTNTEHFTSEEGLQVKDDDIITRIDIGSAITLDRLHPKNLELFFMSDGVNTQTQSAASAQSVTDFPVKKGQWRVIKGPDANDITNDFVFGATLNSVTVTAGGATVPASEYEFNSSLGMLKISESSALAEDTELTIDYDVDEKEYHQISAGQKSDIEAWVLFQGKPAKGNIIHYMGYATIKPTGDIGAVAESEISTIQFEFEFLKKDELGGVPLKVLEMGFIGNETAAVA